MMHYIVNAFGAACKRLFTRPAQNAPHNFPHGTYTVREVIRLKKDAWKPYVLFIGLTEGVGALSGWLTREGVKASANVPKSPLTPPAAVFPIVWASLFALLGIGAARVYDTPPSPERSRALRLFAVQLAVNFVWSPLYFEQRAYGFAFLWLCLLWLLILLMTLSFRRVDRTAALLQLPYLIWTAFAGYLNLTTWLLNR